MAKNWMDPAVITESSSEFVRLKISMPSGDIAIQRLLLPFRWSSLGLHVGMY